MLTGATGFIGCHLQRDLSNTSTSTDNSTGNSTANLSLTAVVRADTQARRPELIPGVNQLALDQSSPAAWQHAIATTAPQHIVLLAGAVRGRDYSDFEPANVLPVRALVTALRNLQAQNHQLPNLLLVSSLAASKPQLSHYAASKRAGEKELVNCPANWSILRPPAVYGPNDEELAGLFNTIRRGLVPRPGPADQRVAFLHATDLTRAIAAWLGTNNMPSGQIYNIHDGTPDGYSWPEIARALNPAKKPVTLPVPGWLLGAAGAINLGCARIFNYQPMLTPGKARELGYPRWLCDNCAFSDATGWQPSIGLAEGSACYFS